MDGTIPAHWQRHAVTHLHGPQIVVLGGQGAGGEEEEGEGGVRVGLGGQGLQVGQG